MIRLFFYSIVSACTIVGSVIGAGFITGREIYVFFASDFSLSGMYLTFICFAISIYFVMSFNFLKFGEKVLTFFIALANLFVSGCMFSAVLKLYNRMFIGVKNIEILAIITAILVFFISVGGIGVMGKFNFALIPIMIFSIVFLGFNQSVGKTVFLTPKSTGGAFNPLIYVGYNVLLSFIVIKNGGEKLTPPFKVMCSALTALILSLTVFIISLSVLGSDKGCEMPFVELFSKDVKVSIIIDIISLFAILTTYASSLYGSYAIVGYFTKFRWKLLLFLASLSISNLGFSKIVDTIYSIIGVVGFLLFLIIYLLSRIFQAKQREHTSRLLKCKE